MNQSCKTSNTKKISFESYASCYLPSALSPAEWTVWLTGVPSLEQLLRFPSNGLLGLNPCPLGWKLGEISLLPELPGLELGNCNRNIRTFRACYYQISELLFIALTSTWYICHSLKQHVFKMICTTTGHHNKYVKQSNFFHKTFHGWNSSLLPIRRDKVSSLECQVSRMCNIYKWHNINTTH